MSEQDDRSPVRRVGRKDRKTSLDPRGPLFPPEDPDVPEPDLAPPDVRTAPARRPQPKAAIPRRRSTCLPNLIALVFLLATVGAIALIALIALNPYTPLNPFPPFTPLPVIITATFLPPTPGAAPTAGPTATFTPIPLQELPTAAPAAPAFTLAAGGALYIPNANEKRCDWSSISGTVSDGSGTGLSGYGVRVIGEGFEQTVFSGAEAAGGPGGFELVLGSAPAEATYRVQLIAPDGSPASDLFTVVTRAACEENVAIIGFVPAS